MADTDVEYPIPPEEKPPVIFDMIPEPRNLKEQVLNLAMEVGIQLNYQRNYIKSLKEDVPYLARATSNPSKVFLEKLSATLEHSLTFEV